MLGWGHVHVTCVCGMFMWHVYVVRVYGMCIQHGGHAFRSELETENLSTERACGD